MAEDRQADTKKEMLVALESKKGIVTDACRSIGLARSTYYDWLQSDPDFKAAVDEIQETAIDYVEGKLFEKISGVNIITGTDDKGNQIVYTQPPSDTAIIFYLKTKAKKRGYVERQELTGPEGKDLVPALDRLTAEEMNTLLLLKQKTNG